MDKLVRKIEIPLAKKAIEKAGLGIIGRLLTYETYTMKQWKNKNQVK